jgi:hypothetical protein
LPFLMNDYVENRSRNCRGSTRDLSMRRERQSR